MKTSLLQDFGADLFGFTKNSSIFGYLEMVPNFAAVPEGLNTPQLGELSLK